MRISAQRMICESAIKNLLSAQKRIAENGDSKEVIRITKFLLNSSNKFCDVLIEIGSDKNGR